MGTSGVSIEKDFTLDEVIALIYECNGQVKTMAAKMGCTPHTVYDYIDVYPELQDHRKRARTRVKEMVQDTADDVMDRLMELVDEDRANARGAAQFILRYGSDSPYNADVKLANKESELKKADRFLSHVQHRINRTLSKPQAMPGDNGIDCEN